jgi:hypothetical protein
MLTTFLCKKLDLESFETNLRTTESELKKMLSGLHSMLPERMLYLCRHLSPTAFSSIFDTQVQILSPEIIWSPALRLQCLRNIIEYLSHWANFLPNYQG